MNKSYQARQNSQNQKFERQVNHWQGVVGMGHWTLASPSIEEIRAYDQSGRELQSRAIVKAVRRLFKGLKTLFLIPIVTLVQQHKERKDLRVLLELDDHVLKDIGVSRADAYGVAKGRISADTVNAQRHATLEKQNKIQRKHITVVQQVESPETNKVKTFAANDPGYSSKCA